MEPNLSQYIQNQIRQAQQLEAQIEQVANQKYQLDMRIKELEKTLKELEAIKEETPVYKSVGNILYQVEDKKKLLDDLSEQKELSEIRIKTLEKQQKTLEEKYKELETILQQKYEEETRRRGSSQ
ncbi:MAG: prefoldin subunit beta [Candidatus Thermoplasmatota archaeon]|jgi:prefoldin beta subunit|nr:prefoldin subunit beta [Candidatus Thermoplasmatota archaeon]MDA8143700.1 prefoldin subunit beta [Thermoplasmatales archaeon]